MKVLLVRRGNKYGPEYCTRLIDQIHRHTSWTEVITLTDQDGGPGRTAPLVTRWPGWWAKMELFAPYNQNLRPALYIDLDSLVLGDISQYDMGDAFTMVEDFGKAVPANSSVMWLPHDLDMVWNAFKKVDKNDIDGHRGPGDQKFLGDFAQHLWKSPDDGIVSYKHHGIDGPVGNIMQFHGKPKPHEIKEGWVLDYWSNE